jgi:hypothetical protein
MICVPSISLIVAITSYDKPPIAIRGDKEPSFLLLELVMQKENAQFEVPSLALPPLSKYAVIMNQTEPEILQQSTHA